MKETLAACVTYQDSHEVFSKWDANQFEKFINSLKSAKEYIDLTMRDEFLLNQAESMYVSKGFRLAKYLP